MRKTITTFMFCMSCLIMQAETSPHKDSLSCTLSGSQTHMGYTLSSEAAVGDGEWTAYQLVTNRHSVLGTRSNTAYFKAGVDLEHRFSDKYILTSKVDGIASVHADHKFYLQQCYVNMKLNHFFVEAGAREIDPVLRDPQLSSGAFVESGNAKPIPQVRIGTDGFWTVPYTKKWLEVYVDFAYGKYVDNSYIEERAASYIESNPTNFYDFYRYVTNKWFHHKQLYFRSNSTKRIFGIIGIDHAVQFGGKVTTSPAAAGADRDGEYSPDLKDFLQVIIPQSDASTGQWISGNHLGSMTFSLGWNINKNHQLIGYLDNIFEDGSGIRKGNGWDGIWGLEYHNKTEGTCYIRDAVAEYIQTTHQSGNIHWDPTDYYAVAPYNSLADLQVVAVGNDNYYNNYLYSAYTQFEIAQGNALITSPRYNSDGYNRFTDNTIRAWHLAIRGDISKGRLGTFGYHFRGSYRQGKGTHDVPLTYKTHSFGASFQVNWQWDSWKASAAYGLDRGNVYGNTNTIDFTISYHGKIL